MDYYKNFQSYLPDTLLGFPKRKESPLQEFGKIINKAGKKGGQTIEGIINSVIDQLYADRATYDPQAARAKLYMQYQNAMDAANNRPLTY